MSAIEKFREVYDDKPHCKYIILSVEPLPTWIWPTLVNITSSGEDYRKADAYIDQCFERALSAKK